MSLILDSMVRIASARLLSRNYASRQLEALGIGEPKSLENSGQKWSADSTSAASARMGTSSAGADA